MSWHWLAIFVILTAGCASPEPIPMGRDTYMLSNTGAWSWSSGAGLKGELFREADAFCRGQGKQLMPINTRSNDGSFSQFAHSELQFRCVLEGDPERERSKPPLSKDEFTVSSVLMPPIIVAPVRRLAVVPLGQKAVGKLAVRQDASLNFLRTRHPDLVLLERDLSPLLDEMVLQHSGRVNDDSAVNLGKLAGADTILAYGLESLSPDGKAGSGSQDGVFELRLIQVESGVVLFRQTVAVTRPSRTNSPLMKAEAEKLARQSLVAQGLDEGYLGEFVRVVDEMKTSDIDWFYRTPNKEQFDLIASVVESRVRAGTAKKGLVQNDLGVDQGVNRRAAAYGWAALLAAFGDNELGIVPSISEHREEGVLLLGILDSGPAHRAGITKGDRITTVNGQRFTTWTAPISLPATLVLERDGKQREVRIDSSSRR